MKINSSCQKISQKPIKYKEFIQQLQNSSRSSINDQSLLSQRSFRQSHTHRDLHEHGNNKILQKTPNYLNKSKKYDQINTYKIYNPNTVGKAKLLNLRQMKDKLYTFCEKKVTQKSVQIYDKLNSKSNLQKKKVEQPQKNQKYFRANKQRNEEKENISFVNQIIQTIQFGGFQTKVLKTQSENIQKLQKTVVKSAEARQNINRESDTKNPSQPSSQRKIQIFKKVFVANRPCNNTMSNRKIINSNLIDQKSRELSLRKNQEKQQKQKESYKKGSTNNKIVSLNINALKSNRNQENSNPKLKIRLDQSCDRQLKSFYIQSRTSMEEAKIFSHSMQKIPSLEQSKIESNLNEGSKSNFLMSGTQLSQLGSFLTKQPQFMSKKEGVGVSGVIEHQKEKEKKLNVQINELKIKLKHFSSGQEKRQVEILQKDCNRLTQSYKQIKRLFEQALREKEQTWDKMQNVIRQNADLKQCLDFKCREANQLKQRVGELSQKVQELNNQFSSRAFPQELAGLSEIIKLKLSQCELQIESLGEENQKLRLLREKLESYNQTLKEEIQEKEGVIWELENKLKLATRRNSSKDQIGDNKINQTRLNMVCKELQSKLKLADIHNEYLTQQIVALKEQNKQLIATGRLLSGTQHAIVDKLSQSNMFPNTITTRNSSISISYSKHHLDPFIKVLNRQNNPHNQT